MGGGAEASVNGDIVIGCEGAKFGFPEVLRGELERRWDPFVQQTSVN